METVVEIRQRGILIDPGIQFLCESARFYYDDRKVIMKGIKQLKTLQGKDLLVGLSMEGEELVVELPPSEKYTILIGGKEHVLSVIK